MSDFVYSTEKVNKELIKDAFIAVYKKEIPKFNYIDGAWGSLAFTENIYNGFSPFITDEYIMVVLGGPLLKFRDNNFISKKDNNEGTKSIFQRWYNKEINWHEDLSGPFHVLIINKCKNIVLSVTDIMSFIPIHSYETKNENYIASHVDILAEVTNVRTNIDEVSVIDFILHGYVTYPYSLYTNIKQLQPSSIHELSNGKLKTNHYWLPKEEYRYNSIKEASNELKLALEDFVGTVLSESNHIAQFISGGEDSRTLSGLLQGTNRDAFVFLDSMNREGYLAKKITQKYNAKFNLRTRKKSHYLDILPDCADLVGSGSEYHHAHTYGFHKEINYYDAVFGGLFSDALLKGARIKKKPIVIKLPFLKEIKDEEFSNENNIEYPYIESSMLQELNNRRIIHLNTIKKFRNESIEEWFELWPSSMNRNIPNVHANRRLFKSYEPFLSNDIVKISASVKQEWKLNRRLFHNLAKPYLRDSKWILHGNGWFPYCSWKPNTLIHFLTWSYRQMSRRLKLAKGNQGPWAEWRSLVKSKQWQNTKDKYSQNIKHVSDELNRTLNLLLEDDTLPNLRYVALTQVLYQLQKGNDCERKH